MVRKVSRSKKADLGISTNAIVVLIIAVVMLGLIIGFIQKMFGDISGDFEESTRNELEPANPTASDPIQLSRKTIITSPGDAESLKIKVKNTGAAVTLSGLIAPKISCWGSSGNIDLSAEFMEGYDSDWAANEVIDFVYNFQVAGGTSAGTKYDCKVNIYNGCAVGTTADTAGMTYCDTGTKLDSIKQQRFTIEVAE